TFWILEGSQPIVLRSGRPDGQLEMACPGEHGKRDRLGGRPEGRPVGRGESEAQPMARRERVGDVAKRESHGISAAWLERPGVLVARPMGEVETAMRHAGRSEER